MTPQTPDSPRRYRVAVLGCGLRGPHHAINFLVNRDRFELVAICDMDTGRLEKCRKLLTEDPWNHKALITYTDAEKMMSEVKPDVFCFATRPTIRLPLIELGIRYGVKAICYEKPMALSLEEGWEITRRLEESGTKATVAHIHKYGGYFQEARRTVAEGRIGEIERVHASCQGWFTGMATHMIDSMIFMMGGNARVSEVSAYGSGSRQFERSPDNASPDYVIANVRFDNNLRGLLDCGVHARHFHPGDLSLWPDTGVLVTGTDGWVEAVLGSGWRAACRNHPEVTGSGEVTFDQIHDGDPYIADLANWLDDDDAVHPCANEITWHTFEAMMAAYISIVEKQPVSLPLTEEQRNMDLAARLHAALVS